MSLLIHLLNKLKKNINIMSQTAIQNLIGIVRNETELHGNTKERIASLLTLLNTEKMDDG